MTCTASQFNDNSTEQDAIGRPLVTVFGEIMRVWRDQIAVNLGWRSQEFVSHASRLG
jgi:hypothetical protein